jgi:hypothetical protein
MQDEARFWRAMEGDRAPAAIDAPHWVSVYTEMLASLAEIRSRGHSPRERVDVAIGVIELRLAFWRALLLEQAAELAPELTENA